MIMKRIIKCISLVMVMLIAFSSVAFAGNDPFDGVCPICGEKCGYEVEPRTEANCKEAAYVSVHCNTIEDFAWMHVGSPDLNRHVGDKKFYEGKPATCTEPGYTDGYKCVSCGEWADGHEYIAPLHPEGHRYSVDNNCESSYTSYGCEICGYYYEEPKTPTAHSWSDWTVTLAPTAAKAGQKTRTCTVCGESQTEVIPAITTSRFIKSVSLGDMTLNYKSTAVIEPEIESADGAEIKVEFKSSAPDVVSVDKTGTVTALRTGSAVITVTAEDKDGVQVKDTSVVTVKYAWWQWIINILLLGFLWY